MSLQVFADEVSAHPGMRPQAPASGRRAGGFGGPQRPGRSGCRRARVRQGPLPASPRVQPIGVVLGRAEQGQDGLATAPAVADMLDGIHIPLKFADREAPARPALLTTRVDIHGVGAARHEALSCKHLLGNRSCRSRIKFYIVVGLRNQTRDVCVSA